MKAYWIAVGLVVAAMGVATSPAGAVEGSFFNDADYEASGRVESKSGGVIAAGNREAALAGLKILDAGGNAVDAAAATLFAVGVAQFESCGIGGGGFMVYRSADGQVVDTIDFREWSPKTYEFSDTASITGTDLAAGGTGHNVVGIPGAVAGMALALEKHGSKPGQPFDDTWKAVLQPAIDLATDGFTVSKASQQASKDLRVTFFPATYAIYGDADELYTKREKMRNQPLADDMLELQRLGPQAFYDPLLPGGTIAADLLVEMNRPSAYNDQARWELSDLTDYWKRGAVSRPAVRTRYRGTREYIGMGAPSSAGTAIAQVLNILEGYDLDTMGQSSADHVHFFAEAMKLAWRDRAKYLGDPDLPFDPNPDFAPPRFETYEDLLKYLTSKEYADLLGGQILRETAQAFGGPSPAEAGNNTHNIAVIDKAGNAVAVNCSIEHPMGSAVTAPGTGFPLNSQLTDFEPPTRDKEGKIVTPAPKGPGDWATEKEKQEGQQGPANGWAPRKRPRSSMAPSIVVRKGVPVLVTGGVGGPSIIGAVAGAFLNVVDFRRDVAHAIDAERSDPRGYCPHRDDAVPNDGLSLCLETTRFDNGVLAGLINRGHRLLSARSCRGLIGDGLPDLNPAAGLQAECEYAPSTLTHSAGINPISGLREAASDPRAFAWAVETASQKTRAETANPGDLTALAAVFQEPAP